MLWLSPAVDRSLPAFRRVLTPGGRLALPDVVVEGDPLDVPAPLTEALCLIGPRSRGALRDRVARLERALESGRVGYVSLAAAARTEG